MKHFCTSSVFKSYIVSDEDIRAKYDTYIAESLNPFLRRSIFEIPSDSFGSEKVVLVNKLQ